MRVTLASIFLTVVLQSSLYAQNPEVYYTVEKTRAISARQDTMRALNHLFQRKRRSTRAKGVVVGVLADAMVIKMWPSHEVRQSATPTNAISQTPVASSSAVPTLYYVFIGFSTGLCLEIISQQRYGERKLKVLLDDYKAGKPIPRRIKSRLSPKDFE